jgi:SagB-type dehydrogenase family enzyme
MNRLCRPSLDFFVVLLSFALSVVHSISGGDPIMTDAKPDRDSQGVAGESVRLPPPRLDSEVSVEQTLLRRRSVREYTTEPLTLAHVSQVLWAAQGITDERRGFRAAPSAGATFPLETYVAAGRVKDLPAGFYKYHPDSHTLTRAIAQDVRFGLSGAALGQEMIRDAPASLVFAAVYERTAERYGDRAVRYVHMEAGHAAQNVYLQVVALDLGTVVVGAFDDASVKKVLQLPRNEAPLYILPIGHPR